jgi:hypothetical protein
MSLNIPTLEQMLTLTLLDLKNKEEDLIKFKEVLEDTFRDKPPGLKDWVLKTKEEEIKELKNTLDKHKVTVREIKLKQILQ